MKSQIEADAEAAATEAWEPVLADYAERSGIDRPEWVRREITSVAKLRRMHVVWRMGFVAGYTTAVRQLCERLGGDGERLLLLERRVSQALAALELAAPEEQVRYARDLLLGSEDEEQLDE